jgi:hypothetical protein
MSSVEVFVRWLSVGWVKDIVTPLGTDGDQLIVDSVAVVESPLPVQVEEMEYEAVPVGTTGLGLCGPTRRVDIA